MHDARYDRQGFTIIEILVVIAIIAVFLGVLGVALSGRNQTIATQGGQRTMAGLVTSARGQAILKQAPVRLIIHNDPPLPGDSPEIQQEKRERYLRYFGIVMLTLDTEVTPPAEVWKPLNEGVFLPRGVYFVPPRRYYLPTGALTDPPGAVISDSNNDWMHARRSVLPRVSHRTGVDRETEEYVFRSEHPAQNFFHIEFNGRGMIQGNVPGNNEIRLVVAPAQATATTPRFEDEGDSYVLGGILRRYGSMTAINHPVAFPEIEPE